MPIRRAFSLVVLFGATLMLLSSACRAERPELVILNWSEYMEPGLIREFEAAYDVSVNEVYFGSIDQASHLLLQSDARGYDLILTTSVTLPFYLKRGWLLQLDPALIPNLRHLDPRWDDGLYQGEHYAVAYAWGTTGIAYRSDLLSQEIDSWIQLYRPTAELQGKVAMIDDPRELLGMGLKSLGYSANSGDVEALRAVERLLLAQKPHVKSYSYTTLDDTAPLLTGEVWASFIYSGDALKLREHNPALRYVLPREGANIWVDYLAISSRTRYPKLAQQFLNFINEPRNAARQAQYVYYATPNQAALPLLPDAFRRDPVIFPPQRILARSEFYRRHSPQVQRMRNQISTRVLSANH